MMAEETLGRDELPLVRVPVGMSSRLRKAFVAAKPRVLLNLSVRARQRVATVACSSVFLHEPGDSLRTSRNVTNRHPRMSRSSSLPFCRHD
jgi:hypothetical protein